MDELVISLGWTVFVLRLPSEPSRHRVAVWRELRRVGAVQLGQGSWALPDAPVFADAVTRVIDLVAQQEGEVSAFAASAIDEATSTRVRSLYDQARLAEWTEFESECGKCLEELAKEIRNEKFTLAELDEEEQNVERIRRWQRELRTRDVFESVPAHHTRALVDGCVAELDRFTTLVYEAVGLA
ncbi:MAG: Chromate resistance protein ChrB [Ilumatobacteraceae bacterium]